MNKSNSAMQRASIMIDTAAHIVSAITGVSIEELKSDSSNREIMKARFLFFELCSGVVTPTYLISGFINRGETVVTYYGNCFRKHYNMDRCFRSMANEASEMFNKLLLTINETVRNAIQEEEQVQC